MRLAAALIVVLAASLPSDALGKGSKTVSVRGHYRKNGTYVRPYMRSPPSRSSYSTSSRTSYRSSGRTAAPSGYSLGAMSPAVENVVPLADGTSVEFPDHRHIEDRFPGNSPPTDIVLSNVSIAENSATGSVVGAFTAVDADKNESHSYWLREDAEGRFVIRGDSLCVAQSDGLDFEACDHWPILVAASDKAGARTEKRFVVALTDVNEPPSDILLSSIKVHSRPARQTVVGYLHAVDQDKSDKHEFALLSDGGKGRFSISGDAIVVGNGHQIDARKAASYSIRVVAKDTGGLSFDKSIDITAGERAALPARYVAHHANGKSKEIADYLERPDGYLIIGTNRSSAGVPKSTIDRIEPIKGNGVEEAFDSDDYMERTWTDSSGSHTTEARFAGLEGGKVRLLKSNGKKLLISFGSLSKPDRAVVTKAIHDDEGK